MCRRVTLCLALTAISFAQVYVPGPQVLTFLSDVDDSDQPYALYLPKHYNSKRSIRWSSACTAHIRTIA